MAAEKTTREIAEQHVENAGFVDMKKTKKEKKNSEPMAIKADAPEYPYGLTIDLNDDSLDKLGIDTLPAVGDVFTVTAKARVTRVSQSSSESSGSNSHKDRNVCMQIEKLKVK